jgi:hypothetical protein
MSDAYLTLTQAAQSLPGRPHVSALWRWCRRGVKARSGERVRLQHVRVGGKLYTTHAWIDAFGEQLASADAAFFDRADEPVDAPPLVVSRQQRQAQIDDARAALARMGV